MGSVESSTLKVILPPNYRWSGASGSLKVRTPESWGRTWREKYLDNKNNNANSNNILAVRVKNWAIIIIDHVGQSDSSG